MNCRVVEVTPLEDERWDNFVHNHPYGWICHLSSWKKIIEESFPHIKGHYLAIVDEGDKIKVALPLYEVNSWLTGKRLVSVPFATLCDPLVTGNYDLRKVLKYALEEIKCKNVKYMSVIRYLEPDDINFEYFSKQYDYLNHYLILRKPEELLKEVFHSSIRKGVNKAVKGGLSIIQGTTRKDVETFYRLYLESRRRLGLPPQPIQFFLNLFNILHSHGRIALLLARLNDKVVGGMIVFKFKDRVSADYLASDINYRALRLDTYLYWMAINLAWEEGYHIFDFGRTSKNNLGLLRYKDGWGTSRKNISHYSDEKSPSTFKENSFLCRLMSGICMHAPRPALQFIGNIIYRHMG